MSFSFSAADCDEIAGVVCLSEVEAPTIVALSLSPLPAESALECRDPSQLITLGNSEIIVARRHVGPCQV